MATSKEDAPSGGNSAKRDKRLAAALRENLRRRKAQARGRSALDSQRAGEATAAAAADKSR